MTLPAPSSSHTLPPQACSASAEAARQAERQLLRCTNPFRYIVVESPWRQRLDIPDVASIYAGETRRALEVVREVAASGASQTVLLLGDAGVGKSHLLRRLATSHRDVAVHTYLYCPSNLDSVLRTVARAVAVSMSEVPLGAARRQIDTFVDRILDRFALAAFTRSAATSAERYDLLALLEQRGVAIWEDEAAAVKVLAALEDYLRREEPGLDRSWLRVFLRGRVLALSTLALDWLKGEALDDDELQRLGVSGSWEGEKGAFEALSSLAHLTRFHKPVVIAIDQTENLPQVGGEPGIRVLVNAICRLHALPGLVFVLACPTDVWTCRYRQLLLESERQRIEEVVIPLGLGGLDAGQVASLVAARLAGADPDFVAAYPTWPFGPDYLAALCDDVRLQPREALQHFRNLVDGFKDQGAVRELSAGDWAVGQARVQPGDTAFSSTAGESLEEMAQQVFARELELVEQSPAAADMTDEELLVTLAAALRGLQQAGADPQGLGAGLLVEPLSPFGDQGLLVFHQETPALGGASSGAVVVCETRRGQSFTATLARCLDVLGHGGGRHPRLLLLRRRPVRSGWTRGREYLSRFLAEGGCHVSYQACDRAAIAALASLRRRAAAGDLFVAGGQVSPEPLVEALVSAGVIGSLRLVRDVLGLDQPRAGY